MAPVQERKAEEDKDKLTPLMLPNCHLTTKNLLFSRPFARGVLFRALLQVQLLDRHSKSFHGSASSSLFILSHSSSWAAAHKLIGLWAGLETKGVWVWGGRSIGFCSIISHNQDRRQFVDWLRTWNAEKERV
jgi:hypothetical protein